MKIKKIKLRSLANRNLNREKKRDISQIETSFKFSTKKQTKSRITLSVIIGGVHIAKSMVSKSMAWVLRWEPGATLGSPSVLHFPLIYSLPNGA